MSDLDQHPAIEIDPRKVERYERYLLAYARTHALDPMEHRRREAAGLYFLARQRLRGSVLDAIAQARADGRPFVSPAAPGVWNQRCRTRLFARR